MKKYNIVFLDFDGVINSDHWLQRFYQLRKTTQETTIFYNLEFKDKTKETDIYWANSMDYRLIELLANTLNKVKNPKVVLSTSWKGLFSTEKWNELFNNLKCWNIEIIGKTPKDLNKEIIPVITLAELIGGFSVSENSRGLEIQKWLVENENIVENYIILDDFDDMLKEQAENFILTNAKTGITKEDMEQLLKILS